MHLGPQYTWVTLIHMGYTGCKSNSLNQRSQWDSIPGPQSGKSAPYPTRRNYANPCNIQARVGDPSRDLKFKTLDCFEVGLNPPLGLPICVPCNSLTPAQRQSACEVSARRHISGVVDPCCTVCSFVHSSFRSFLPAAKLTGLVEASFQN